MPQAMYSFGATVLPVWPTCVEYGYQPASTTARVAATAPPSACASSSTNLKFSGPPRPRPPATITCASDCRPLARRVRLLDHRGGRGEVLQLHRRVLDLRLAAGLLRIERAGA